MRSWWPRSYWPHYITTFILHIPSKLRILLRKLIFSVNFILNFFRRMSSNPDDWDHIDLITLLHLYRTSLLSLRYDTTKKTHISCRFCFEIFFVENIYKFCCEKNCKKLLSIFLQNTLYKIFFATNFVWNTYKFYNFVGNTYKFYNFLGNDYPRRNYLLIKILRKMTKKENFFLQIFLTNLQKKFHVIWEFLIVGRDMNLETYQLGG